MNWSRFLRARLARLVVVVAALLGFTFLMLHLAPGDPARLVAGHEAHETLRAPNPAARGGDPPMYAPFGSYVAGAVQGDLGRSFSTREEVSSIIAEKIGPTMQLAGLAMAVIVLVGIPLGIAGAVASRGGRRGVEVAFSSVTGALAAIPQYLVATFLAFAFAVTWQLFPVAGNATLAAAVLPALAIALRPSASIARLVRIRTLEVLESPYIRTARSKRLRRRTFYLRHVLPNAVTTVLAISGMIFAGLIGGAVIVELVFARPGLGTSLVDAVLMGDYPVVQGIVLLLGVLVVVINAVVDVLNGLVDPRTVETAR